VEVTGSRRLTRVWLGQDGADAVEAAMKLARAATGRPVVLAVRGGFHGKTLGALAATWHPRYREPVLGLLRGVATSRRSATRCSVSWPPAMSPR